MPLLEEEPDVCSAPWFALQAVGTHDMLGFAASYAVIAIAHGLSSI